MCVIKLHMKNIKFDLSFILVIAIQLILIIDIISVIANNDSSMMSHILIAIIAILGWGSCEYFRQKNESK